MGAVALVAGCLALGVLAAGCGQDNPDDSGTPPAVRVSDFAPAPNDRVTIEVVTRDRRAIDGANYHFTVVGPAGAHCSRESERALGLVTSEATPVSADQESVELTLHPTRSAALFDKDPGGSWCPGKYVGAVDYRVPGVNTERRELASGITIYGRLIGEFSFRVAGP
jgi:hypothetical protein